MGALLLNHYSLPHDDEIVSAIRQHDSLLTVIACLSVPAPIPPNDSKADQTLFSPGKDKVLVLGYGAFGHVKRPFKNQRMLCNCPELQSIAHDQMETHWKSVLNDILFDPKTPLTSDRIDEGFRLVHSNDNYLQRVDNILERTSFHKSNLNGFLTLRSILISIGPNAEMTEDSTFMSTIQNL
jgi:hypothetical protein